MTLPTLEKTWQFSVNNVANATGDWLTESKRLMFSIKNSLVNFASSPWTVVRSSNASTYGAADYWLSYTNCVWGDGGSPRSWIVLAQAGLAGGTGQILISLRTDSGGGYPRYYSMYYSPAAGFTGGTTTSRPTATDEVTVVSADTWDDCTNTAARVAHVMQTTDGSCTRVFLCNQGACRGGFLIESLGDSPASNHVVCMNLATHTAITCNTSARFVGRYSGVNFSAYLAMEAYASTRVVDSHSGYSTTFSPSKLPIEPLYVHSETTGALGYHGRLVDLFAGSSSTPTGTTYPRSPDSKLWAQFSRFVTPWDGSSKPRLA